MRWEAFCFACVDTVSTDGARLTVYYYPIRCGTWIAQFGLNAKGACSACSAPVDFYNFQRAYDVVYKEGGEKFHAKLTIRVFIELERAPAPHVILVRKALALAIAPVNYDVPRSWNDSRHWGFRCCANAPNRPWYCVDA